MPKHANKPAALRESWRPDSANAEQMATRKRMIQRLLITSLLAALTCVLGILLFSPFYHPTLRLYFMTAGSYEATDLKPIPFFQEDAVRFLSIDGSFQKQDATDEFSIMGSPDSVRTVLERIANAATYPSDVALIHISASPITLADRPFLQCSNFQRENPELGSISIEEIFNLLDRIPAGTTLVCLDLGPSYLKSVSDLARDHFLYAVRDLLKSRTNPNLWLLLSNSDQEGSYASQTLQSSVFSYAVSNGLQGAADLNSDGSIDLDEFARFVIGTTQAHVQMESGGKTQQTPILFSTSTNSNVSLNTKPISSAPKPSFQFSWSSLVSNWWADNSNKEEG